MKTLIDIDEAALQAAQNELQTTSKKDTVNAALAEVVQAAARRRDLMRLREGVYADLLDDTVMSPSWQR
jgi:Arc/MetJ family transcription regulator